jgi:hypothetical protein
MSTYAVPNVEDRILALTETLSRALAVLEEVGNTHVSRGGDTGIEEAKRAALALADEARTLETLNQIGRVVASELDL